MSYKFDLAVVIGRMQPPHLGHFHLIHRATKLSENVLVLIGSSFGTRSIKNPWSFSDIASMIRSEFPQPGLAIRGIPDYLYSENEWISHVQAEISGDPGSKGRIALVGHEKDGSSYYLRSFPNMTLVDVGEYGPSSEILSSTKIRELLFTGHEEFIRSVVPKTVFSYLENHRDWRDLKEDFKFVQNYKERWSAAPYPPTFVTVDAVVIQSGHVLLVRRGHSPGKGLWALPGGFVGQDETCKEACLRELLEETSIKVPGPILSRNIKGSQVFDHPGRSMRGRTITIAFHIKLDDPHELPKVKGGDDAELAAWIPLSQFKEEMRNQLFEDHWDIVNYFINR